MTTPPDTNLPRRLLAEGLGTALLVATVIGSGIMAAHLSGGNDGIALLGNTLATAAILPVLIIIFAPLSGAHFNPAVSLAFMLRGQLPLRLCALYIPVQIIGALCGTALSHLMFDLAAFTASTNIRSGTGQWISEGVATFGLILTILCGLRHRPDAVPFMVGLYIAAGYWFTASTSFANPAVTIARAFTDSFSGIRPVDITGFISAQTAGTMLAALLFRTLFPYKK